MPTLVEKGKAALGCPQQGDMLKVLVPSPSEEFPGQCIVTHSPSPGKTMISGKS